MRTRPDWCRQRSLGGPSGPDPGFEGVPLDTERKRPIGETHRAAVMREHDVASSISRLLVPACPAAIIRAVAARVIDAFKLAVRWARTDVFNEGCEVIPAFAPCDTPSSIGLEVLVVGVPASISHRGPYDVLGPSLSVSRVSVLRDGISVKASAALAVSRFQVASVGERFRAALTGAPPQDESALGSMFGWSEDSQASKKAAGQVFGGVTLRGSHAVSSFIGAVLVRGWRSLATGASSAFNYPTEQFGPAWGSR